MPITTCRSSALGKANIHLSDSRLHLQLPTFNMAVRRRSTKARRRRRTRRASTPRAPRRRISKRRSRKVKTPKRRASKRRAVAKRTVRKAKKPKKAKRVGKMWQVWKGTRERTAGGLKKKDLRMNKRGKIVSKKASANAQKRMKSNSSISQWCSAIKQVRKQMNLKGFVPCKKGSEYYNNVLAIYKA